jgi:5-deoxy-D-glucuronate isomerase
MKWNFYSIASALLNKSIVTNLYNRYSFVLHRRHLPEQSSINQDIIREEEHQKYSSSDFQAQSQASVEEVVVLDACTNVDHDSSYPAHHAESWAINNADHEECILVPDEPLQGIPE